MSNSVAESLSKIFDELIDGINELISRKVVVFLPFKGSACDAFDDIYSACVSACCGAYFPFTTFGGLPSIHAFRFADTTSSRRILVCLGAHAM